MMEIRNWSNTITQSEETKKKVVFTSQRLIFDAKKKISKILYNHFSAPCCSQKTML